MIKSKIGLNYITGYIISLLPFLIIVGPAAADIAIVIIALYGVYLIIKKKKFEYLNNIYFKFFILFWLYILLCSFFSENILYSLDSSLFYFRFIFFGISVWYFLDYDETIINKTKIVFYICFILIFFDTLLQFYSGVNLLGYSKAGTRLSSFFGDEFILGSFISRNLPLFLGLILLQDKKNTPFLTLIMICLSMIIVILSGERTALLYILILILFLLFLTRQSKIFNLFAFFFYLFLAALIIFFSANVKDRMFTQTFNQIFGNKDQINIFSGKHQSLYKVAFNVFKENIYFGTGPKTFRINCSKDIYFVENGCSSHPHNIYLQLLAETGIFGFVIIFSLFFFILIKFIQQFYYKFFNKYIFTNPEITILIAVFISLFPIIPGPNFFNNWINVIYYLPLGFFLHIYEKRKKLNV